MDGLVRFNSDLDYEVARDFEVAHQQSTVMGNDA